MNSNNSPTVQNMISQIRPGSGNIPIGSVQTPSQFQFPYPSPMQMVTEIGCNQYANPNQMYGMGFPGVQNFNGIPMEAPNNGGGVTTTYRTLPGAPVNPGLAGMDGVTEVKTPRPGRVFDVQSDIPYYANTLQSQVSTNRFVGTGPAFNPYGMPSLQAPTPTNTNSPIPGVYVNEKGEISIPKDLNKPQHPDFMGAVTIYNGQMIHPHSNMSWYGSVDFPLNDVAGQSMINARNGSQSVMRDKFNSRFPGYTNPYAPYGFMQTPQQTSMITPEIQDTANLAAYYGMSYDEFINNTANIYKICSRAVNKALGTPEEKADKLCKKWDVKYPPAPGSVPEDEDAYFYPRYAFNMQNQFTNQYKEEYCRSSHLTDDIKKMKVVVVRGDKVIPGSNRKIKYSESRDKLDNIFKSNYNYHMWLANNEQRFASMYWSAPERQMDHIEGNVFQVAAESLAGAKQKELERKLEYQRATKTSQTFMRDEYIDTLRGIRNANRIRKREIQERKWHDFIMSTPDEPMEPVDYDNPQSPNYRAMPIRDGHMVYAQDGYDVRGIPLDKSVHKIIAMNEITGEEEIYNPDQPRMIGADVRARLLEAVQHPNVSDMSEDELVKRLSIFSGDEYRDF